jgi:hypothetical protein
MYLDNCIAISFNLDTAAGTWSDHCVTLPSSTGSAAREAYTITNFAVADVDVGKCSRTLSSNKAYYHAYVAAFGALI